MNKRILLVDDDPQMLSAYGRCLKRGYQVETASSGEEGLVLLERWGPFAVIVADYQMPGMNGLEFLKEAQRVYPETVRIMVTGHGRLETAMNAVNEGRVFQFLTKPCPAGQLVAAVNTGIRQYELVTTDRELKEKTLRGILQVLMEMLEISDPETFRFCETIQDYVRIYCALERLPDAWRIEVAAIFSHLGVVTLPPGLSAKAQRNATLSKEEQKLWNGVAETGAELLAGLPGLEEAARIVRFQHKNMDGSGPPVDQKTAPEEIPLGSRILRVFSQLVQQQNKKTPRHVALEEMRTNPDRYDPEVVERAMFMVKANLKSVGLPEDHQIVPRTVRELRVNDLVMADVLTEENLVVVTAGIKLSKVMVEKIKNFAEAGDIHEPIFVTQRAPTGEPKEGEVRTGAAPDKPIGN